MKLATVKSATDALRDLRNWLAVFKTEYDLSDEAYKVLHQKIEQVGASMDNIVCKEGGVDSSSVQPASNALRDVMNWLAVFKQEYSLADEAVQVLEKEINKVADKFNEIECV